MSQSLEDFIKQTIVEGVEQTNDFDQLKEILEELDEKEKAIYLRYDVSSNV